jgi:hypothetical protein
MTPKEFITSLEIEDFDTFLYDMAANGVLVGLIELWLREFCPSYVQLRWASGSNKFR